LFEIGDRLGNGWLGHVELDSCPSHAAGLDDGHQDIEIVQFEAASNAIGPRHNGHPFQIVMVASSNTIIL
jgi:hypothetical protein